MSFSKKIKNSFDQIANRAEIFAKYAVLGSEIAELDERISKELQRIEDGEFHGETYDLDGLMVNKNIIGMYIEQRRLKNDANELDRIIALYSSQELEISESFESAAERVIRALDRSFLMLSSSEKINVAVKGFIFKVGHVFNKISNRDGSYWKCVEDARSLSGHSDISLGLAFELFVGRDLERQGLLVIYNGIIKGYEDHGVDLIAFNEKEKHVYFIQCKNWYKREMNKSRLDEILERMKVNGLSFSRQQLVDSDKVSLQKSPRIVSLLDASRSFDCLKILYVNEGCNFGEDVEDFFDQGLYKDLILLKHDMKKTDFFGNRIN